MQTTLKSSHMNTGNQGRRKHQKMGGGTGFQEHFGILKRAPKTFFGGGRNFPVKSYPNYTFLTEFPNKKGTFGVNLVFTATLACTKRALFITKRALFITKKGTFFIYLFSFAN